ncbi:LysE family translocator [Photobacterium sanguinicancri]|uniref:LysE family transporter n=1 Tax=Photobacterium sanguinicancri TaxID=875932 RepID=A0AAW7Y5K8_9GAMM|nr:LysE family transporter [Photobacterium sanguinicancri]MDO6543906.1 LysE family transporter [Photobacterium sanguinicancri]
MTFTLALLNVALIWMFAVATPGANVLLTVNTALHYDRKLALFSAFGVSTAILLWAFFGGSGLVILFTHYPQLFGFMKLVGGCYLLYLGIRQIYQTRKSNALMTGANAPTVSFPSSKKIFLTAFITSILNPKTGFFVVSVFSISMPAHMTGWMVFAIMLTMSSITLVWHVFLGVAFSRQSAKSVYQRISHYIDYATGGLFTLFGIKVMAS